MFLREEKMLQTLKVFLVMLVLQFVRYQVNDHTTVLISGVVLGVLLIGPIKTLVLKSIIVMLYDTVFTELTIIQSLEDILYFVFIPVIVAYIIQKIFTYNFSDSASDSKAGIMLITLEAIMIAILIKSMAMVMNNVSDYINDITMIFLVHTVAAVIEGLLTIILYRKMKLVPLNTEVVS